MAALQLSTRTNFPVAPTDVASELVLLASLQALEAGGEEQRKRPSLDVVLVLDKSGSMQGEKLHLCKQTLKFLAEVALQEHDHLALVTFDSNVYVEFPGAKMTQENKLLFLQAVDKIQAGSNTNLSGGLLKGIDLLRALKTPSEVSAVCILTDGQINEGITDKAALVKATTDMLASFVGRSRPSVFTFGYGTDADTDILTRLAAASGGSYYAMPNTDAVPIAFADCLGGLTSVAAQNIELVVSVLGGGASFLGNPLTTYRFEVISPTQVKVVLKDMYSGEHRDLLFKIQLPKTASPEDTVIRATVKYIDSINEKQASGVSECIVSRVKGESMPSQFAVPDVEVTRHLIRIETAFAMEEAKKIASRGDLSGGQAVLRNARGKMKECVDLAGIDAEGDAMMSELNDDMEEAEQTMSSTQTFRTEGVMKMSAMSEQHYQQRSHAIPSANRAAPSSYANLQKKSMMQSAKAAFGMN